jgi:hypothetical protein
MSELTFSYHVVALAHLLPHISSLLRVETDCGSSTKFSVITREEGRVLQRKSVEEAWDIDGVGSEHT